MAVYGPQRHGTRTDTALRPQDSCHYAQYTAARNSRGKIGRDEVRSYKSSDGLEIPAYLTLPKGVVAKNLPHWSSLMVARGDATIGL